MSYFSVRARDHGVRGQTNDNAFDQRTGDFAQVDPAAATVGRWHTPYRRGYIGRRGAGAAPIFKVTRPDEVFGSLKVAGPPKTLEEMDAGVAAEARRRYARD